MKNEVKKKMTMPAMK